MLVAVLVALAPPAAAAASDELAARLGAALGQGAVSVQELDLPGAAAAPVAPFAVHVDLGDEPAVLLLAPHSLRADGYRLLVDDGGGPRAATPSAPRTYRGRIAGRRDSVVAASLLPDGLVAFVRPGAGRAPFGIQPVARLLGPGAAGGRAHAVYDATDALPQDVLCGLRDTPAAEPAPPDDPSAPDGGASIVRIAEIACDADVEFWQQNGSSVSATEADIEGILNAVEAIFADDVNVLFDLTAILVNTGPAGSDPYTTNVAADLLGEFDAHWTAVHAAIPRDLAHLFTGKNLAGPTIGLTHLGSVCNSDGYGLSQSRYTANMTHRVALTAHEIGHAFNAVHCNGNPVCWIMCASVAACGPVTSFAPQAVDAINQKKAVSPCLDQLPPEVLPTLAGASPDAVPSMGGGQVTLTGTGFDGVTEVVHGGVAVTEPEFFAFTDSQLVYVVPPVQLPELGPTGVHVRNALGPSNSIEVEILATAPPALEAELVAPTQQPFTWTFGGVPGHTAFLILSLDPQTFPYQGYDILLHLVILHTVVLTGSGVDTLTLTIPASALGLSFYSQVATLGPTFAGASQIEGSVIPF